MERPYRDSALNDFERLGRVSNPPLRFTTRGYLLQLEPLSLNVIHCFNRILQARHLVLDVSTQALRDFK